MYTLIVDYSSFTLDKDIYIVDPSGNTIGVTHLPTDKIAEYAVSDPRVDDIKIKGIGDQGFGIKEQIEKTLALEYANKKIKVEVIK